MAIAIVLLFLGTFYGEESYAEFRFPKRGETYLDFQADGSLKIDISMAKKEFRLGEDIHFTVSLESKKTQEVYILDSAQLDFKVEWFFPPGERVSVFGYLMGGRTKWLQRLDGKGSALILIAQEKILLEAGEKLEKRLNLSKIVREKPSVGHYVMSVVYENVLKAQTTFDITFNYHKTIPLLINTLEKEDYSEREWARNNLMSLIGKPLWYPDKKDSMDTIKSEANKLRQWWKENKDNEKFQEEKSN